MMTLERAPEDASQTLIQAAPWPTVRCTRRVAVFAGSACGHDDAYLAGARAMGREIAGRRLELVYGGTVGGLMGAVAEAVREQGVRSSASCLGACGRICTTAPVRWSGW